jgi:uncharacterized protein (TIGR00255 family)
MIFSMTGFSAADTEHDTGSLSLEIRSVNHRYLDIQIRIPDELRNMEAALRERLSAQIARGKVECRIGLNSRSAAGIPARLNLPLLRQLVQWNREVRDVAPAAGDLSVADILRWNGMLTSESGPAEQLHEQVLQLLQKALLDFNAARMREGAQLKDFLLQRTGQINALRIEIAPRIPAAIRAYEAKLSARLLEALGNHDDERVRQEISLFASKIDVDEELSRLHTHLSEVERVLERGGSVGKRLDFLMQELHREANTLGAKSVDAKVSRASMEMKLLIEQMREQIQNLE